MDDDKNGNVLDAKVWNAGGFSTPGADRPWRIAWTRSMAVHCGDGVQSWRRFTLCGIDEGCFNASHRVCSVLGIVQQLPQVHDAQGVGQADRVA